MDLVGRVGVPHYQLPVLGGGDQLPAEERACINHSTQEHFLCAQQGSLLITALHHAPLMPQSSKVLHITHTPLAEGVG